VGLYFSVLLASYLLVFFNALSILYGWGIIPVAASFFVGWCLVEEEVDTVVKINIACFFLHAGIIIGLLNVPLVYDAFWSLVYEVSKQSPFLGTTYPEASIIGIIFAYYILNIPWGITASFIGGTIREYSSDIIAVCTYLVKKMKQIIEKAVSKVRR